VRIAVIPVFVLAATLWLAPGMESGQAQESDPVDPVAPVAPIARGEYLFRAANCQSCHTDAKNKGKLLAGGRALKTPFGTFYGPNITPDEDHGIGAWSDADFIAALRHGRAPDGSHYFPAFPFTAFTKMTDADMLALKAYIFTLPAVDRPNTPHEIDFPFGWRFLMSAWKWLAFDPEIGRASCRERV
jgi:mono/diheme cytochrome c family protein